MQILKQQLCKKFAVVHCARKQNHLRRRAASQVVLLDKRGNRVGHIVADRQNLIVLVKKIPVHIVQNGEARLGLGLIVANHVGVGHRPGRDELALAERLYGLHPVAQLGSLFKLQILRRLLHLFPQFLLHLRVAALQHQNCLLHTRAVFPGASGALAPCVAVIHVVVEARPFLSEVARKTLAAAGQLQRQTQRINDHLRHVPPAVGPKIACSVVHDPAHQLHHRVFFPHIHAKIRIALVILQKDVVLWHVPLDERALKHQRFKFARRNDNVKVVDLTDHFPRLRRMGAGILKILADAVFELFRLADVDDLSGLVLHDIYARLIWQRQRLVF